jgi:hypothetical protein
MELRGEIKFVEICLLAENNRVAIPIWHLFIQAVAKRSLEKMPQL